ncbi:oligosaccharide flippase family protein [Flavobacterium faecale]|uniref:oligosaccharide flippase family protein n=1 Tax=Flavobacterium faecale TaxID=1355330 RepID=UPI003AABE74A
MKNLVFKSYLYLFLSQSISLVINILMSIVIPKLLNVETFGYWQLFLFYTSFVGFFHFGLNDGIYLRYGGKNLEHLNGGLLKAQFLFLFFLQIILAISFFIYQYFYGREDLNQIIVFVVIFMIISNLTSFMTSVFQAVNKLNFFSILTIITSSTFLLFIGLLFLFNKFNLLYITLSYTISYFLGLIYVLYKSKNILLSKIDWSYRKTFLSECKLNTVVGFFLMISTISSILILGVGRFAIEKKWGVVTFGVISLCFTITTLLLFFIRQIGLVIFPLLKKVNIELQKKYFSLSINILNIILLGCLLLLPLINFIILGWLPKYSDSLNYFIFILPLVIYEGKTQIILVTYMKVQRKEKELMYINVVSMLFSFLLCGVGYYFSSIVFIIIAMTFSSIVRGSILEYFLNLKMGAPNTESLIVVFSMTVLFGLFFNFFESKVAWFSYLAIYGLYLISNMNSIKQIRKEVKLFF